MIPIKDDNPTLRTPVITIALVVVNALVWLVVQGAGSNPALAQSLCNLGLIPAELTGRAAGQVMPLGAGLACKIDPRPAWYTIITSMFMHGGWMHIIGNMWFLWIFGNNVEDSMGRFRFVLFYLISGTAAALTQIVVDPGSPLPMVGASGAIGGVMGAYVVLYPKVPVHLLVFFGFFVTVIAVPAYLMLGYWFVLQLIGGLPQLGAGAGGVAFWAHVGGFLTGVLFIFLFRNVDLVEEHRQIIQQYGYRYGHRR